MIQTWHDIGGGQDIIKAEDNDGEYMLSKDVIKALDSVDWEIATVLIPNEGSHGAHPMGI